MKKIYGYILAFSLIIPGFAYSIRPEKPSATKWWETYNWKKTAVYSAAAILATALTLFGSYQGMIKATKSVIKADLDAAIAGRKKLAISENNAYLARYRNASPQERNAIINEIVSKGTLADIAFTAIFGNQLP